MLRKVTVLHSGSLQTVSSMNVPEGQYLVASEEEDVLVLRPLSGPRRTYEVNTSEFYSVAGSRSVVVR